MYIYIYIYIYIYMCVYVCVCVCVFAVYLFTSYFRKCSIYFIYMAARNRALWTPLDCAAAKGKVDVVKVLLDAGGPIENRDKNNVRGCSISFKVA